MAFTRFHDDPARITIQLQQQTDQERWYLDVPGNGDKPCFMLDPQIIPQKWGGNLWTHTIDIQSSLLGIDRQLNRDCLRVDKNGKDVDKYKRQTVYASPIDYPVCDTLTTEQSRAIMPAWTARDLQQNHAYILPNNPQAHTEMPFQNYKSSRILEKDSFKREFDCVPQNNQFYTVPTDVYNSQYKGKNNIGGQITCNSDCSKVMKKM
jgi:hypothetical protein